MIVHCPQCKSAAVVRVRHDSDWGGPNQQVLLNPDKFYADAMFNGDRTEFGDIDLFFCLACRLYLNFVHDDSGNVWTNSYQLGRARAKDEG